MGSIKHGIITMEGWMGGESRSPWRGLKRSSQSVVKQVVQPFIPAKNYTDDTLMIHCS